MTKAFLPYLFILPSLAYSLLAYSAISAFFRRVQKSAEIWPSVSIIKPIKGLDEGSRQNLESFCTQAYPEYQIVFALQSPDDPCIPVIRQLMADYPEVDSELVINADVHGVNAKVNNLVNAFPLLKHDIIVITDSDIRVKQDYLANIVSYFADTKVGMVTSLYRGANIHSSSAALEALGFSVEMIPNVIVAERLEGLSFALGASMAVRRSSLESIGGFLVLKDYLADDYQLGNMIHRGGWKIALSGDFVESVMPVESFLDVFSRLLRWSRTMRVSRPWGYLASGITHPFPAVLLSFLVSGFTAAAFSALLVLYLGRVIVLVSICRRFVKDSLLPKYIWLLPVRDALSSVTWALAFLGNRINWRGESYLLKADGRILKQGA